LVLTNKLLRLGMFGHPGRLCTISLNGWTVEISRVKNVARPRLLSSMWVWRPSLRT